ncbi:CopG family transcriptional regulator [Castellaniella sp. GW247-6E4]|uniref:CopG family transcriptional regulator n=1 Tax=Castellaniella sp. GW247-6E4 TaxID=3140380 RepID=UPI0033156CAC
MADPLALAQIVEAQQRPRAAVIRDAVEAYIANHARPSGAEVFGAWRDKRLDGLEYQQTLRSEW